MKNYIKTLLCLCFLVIAFGISSCTLSNTEVDEDKIINEIGSKYYSLNGKFNEVTFKVTSSFLDNLINNSGDKRVENLRGIEFLAKLDKSGQLYIAVQNKPNNLTEQDEKFVDSAIGIMKKQVNGVFLGISPLIGGLLNKDKYEVKVIKKDKKEIIIQDRLKGTHASDKLYFDNKLKLKKWETFSGISKISDGIPVLGHRDNLLFFDAINVEMYQPQHIKSENAIEYKDFKGVLLPYKIFNKSFSNGNIQESVFTLEPIEMK